VPTKPATDALVGVPATDAVAAPLTNAPIAEGVSDAAAAPSAAVTDAAVPLVSGDGVAGRAATRASPTSASNPKGDAAALFSAAALARREGNAGKAVALLDSLQQRFPASREARSSDMTLGSLHLQRGAPAAALEHFGRYLRTAPRGELASEALWGQAQALTALGRRSEAEARLRQLVERFPGSPYAAASRVKLGLAAP
jgi:TolA-binding protein